VIPVTSLRELAWLFLRLGSTSFGGPAAHIAMMHDEVVLRRQWMSAEAFMDLVGATNLIPGPSSTELAIHVGWGRRGWSGLLVAGLSFILPAMLITLAFAWAYVRFGALPQTGWLLYGVKPVVLVVILQAFGLLAPKAAGTWPLRFLGAGAVLLSAFGVNELVVLFGCGAAALIARSLRGRTETSSFDFVIPFVPLASAGAVTGVTTVTLSGVFWIFLKTGSVLFGSGYVLLAFLRADLVERFHWLTEAQLLDASAVGQVTPGPVFTTATFIGYLLAGTNGALVATLGIFLPAFVFVALSGPLVPRLRASATASAFLDGINVASLALMAVVTAQLARGAVVDVTTTLIGLISALLLFRYKLGSAWLVLIGAAIGCVANAAGLAR